MPLALELPEDLVIDQAAAIAADWLARLETCTGPVVAVAAQATHVDTAGIQLLLALGKEAEARGLELELAMPSPRLLLMLQTMHILHRFRIAS
ncbi:STAS domain-containing protein [Thermomonas sp.]|uniref:STAS domain-containing protein n=1 Tax=Thermomonas sp. TaxID=1971895 RepID=UPI0035AE0CB4